MMVGSNDRKLMVLWTSLTLVHVYELVWKAARVIYMGYRLWTIDGLNAGQPIVRCGLMM